MRRQVTSFTLGVFQHQCPSMVVNENPASFPQEILFIALLASDITEKKVACDKQR